jgi:hypothetical protein
MQGYLFSPAKPAAEIKRLLFSHRNELAAVDLGRGRARRQVPGAV